MNEVIKQMQKRIVEGIQLPDKKQENQLRKDVKQALQESIKDLAEHGGGQKAEDRFWKRLEHIAAKEPKNRIIYQHYQDISYFWQYTENWYSCYPPNLSEEEREKSLCTVEIERPDSEKYGSYLTAFLPCDSEGLKKFFEDNGIDMKNCDIGEIYCGSEKTSVLTEIFERMPRQDIDIFRLNEVFSRFEKLPEEMQRVYGLTLQLKEPRTVKEMINLMDHLSEVCVVNGIQNENQLGEFLVENELFDTTFPNEVLPYLDYTKIGREYMQTHKSKIIHGVYVEDTSYYEMVQIGQESTDENEQSDDYEMKL